ncbi:MAG: hypothetical protein ACPGJS_09365 [Flammeovirgaceae bacterium]
MPDAFTFLGFLKPYTNKFNKNLASLELSAGLKICRGWAGLWGAGSDFLDFLVRFSSRKNEQAQPN